MDAQRWKDIVSSITGPPCPKPEPESESSSGTTSPTPSLPSSSRNFPKDVPPKQKPGPDSHQKNLDTDPLIIAFSTRLTRLEAKVDQLLLEFSSARTQPKPLKPIIYNNRNGNYQSQPHQASPTKICRTTIMANNNSTSRRELNEQVEKLERLVKIVKDLYLEWFKEKVQSTKR